LTFLGCVKPEDKLIFEYGKDKFKHYRKAIEQM